MIYGKIWCVVKPSVGIPLFLSAVAIGSFAVHVALVTNTTWVKDFLQGGQKTAAAQPAVKK
jgi:light-harvesting protein B-800-850 alpha chain